MSAPQLSCRLAAATLLAFGATSLACTPDPAPAEAKPRPSLFEPDADTPAPDLSGTAPITAVPQPASPRGPLQLTDVTEAWGITLRHHGGRHDDKWIPETMSGGVALVDIDRNGTLDIVLADGGDLVATTPNPEMGPKLLLGDGHGKFTDVTTQWGLTAKGYGMGVAAGDVDNDGWVDLYLTSFDGSDRLLHNDEGKGLSDVTEAWGVGAQGWSTSAAFFDMEGDGDLDLYVVRYIDYDPKTALKCWFRSIHIYCTPAMYHAQPDRLLRNDGGRFVDVSGASGVAAHAAKGLAIGTGDLDDDGDTDLYVANDTSRNLLLVNDGTGKFEETGMLAGVAYSDLGREEASMGVAIGDSDADGRWDLAVTNFQAEPTSLYARREDGTYRERSDAAGIGASARSRLSFGIEWIDVDNNGLEDLLTANGHISDNVATYREQIQFAQLDSLYERTADGRFADVSDSAGTALAARGVSRGLATGDLDNDGGLDYVVVNNDGPLRVSHNTTPARGHWLSLWLEGTAANRSAIGAIVTVTSGGVSHRREVRGSSSYLSVSDRRIHLGLGEAMQADTIEIRWPSGDTQTLRSVPADAHLRIVQGSEPEPYTPGEVVPP